MKTWRLENKLLCSLNGWLPGGALNCGGYYWVNTLYSGLEAGARVGKEAGEAGAGVGEWLGEVGAATVHIENLTAGKLLLSGRSRKSS